MGENTGIKWTDHTLNFWWGCTKVSPGCKYCYAEQWAKRTGKDIWGPGKPRMRTEGPWVDVLRWDRKAGRDGVRRRVFAQSMSDFFEDHPQLYVWRAHAFPILESLEHLEIQLLTKHIDNVAEMVPERWLHEWPAHIWLGTTIEDQDHIWRAEELLRLNAPVHFVSAEPLLGPLTLEGYLGEDETFRGDGIGIDWVICGGESGTHARPFDLGWALDLRMECQAHHVPFFMKQMGHNPTSGTFTGKGENPREWPIDLRVQEFPDREKMTS